MVKRSLYIIFLILFLATSVYSATYYVAQSAVGGDTGADCANAKSLSWFNSNASAGDTATLCDGTFTTQIIPTNSGSAGNPIVYIADTQYNAIIQNASYGANLANKNYIKIDGLYFNNCGHNWVRLYNADYNIIQNNKFNDADTQSGIRVQNGSDYNQILDNIFEDADNIRTADQVYWTQACIDAWAAKTTLPSACDADTAPADFIGFYEGVRNVVEGNTFGNSRHTSIYQYHSGAGRLIIRDNIFNNAAHSNINPLYGSQILIENNIVKNGGSNKNRCPQHKDREIAAGHGVYVMIDHAIIRKNKIFNNDTGYYFGAFDATGCISIHQKFYNNSLYNNTWQVYHANDGLDIDYNNNILKNNIFEEGPTDFTAHDMNSFNFSSDVPRDNGFNDVVNYPDGGTRTTYYINNLWGGTADDIFFKDTATNKRALAYCETNYSTEWNANNFEGNPIFVDALNDDFTLQSTSDAIDAGTYLTEVNDAGGGSGTSMVVDDAKYFYDGWGISGETADYIWVDNPTSADFLVQISSINYGTHTLTLASSQTWDDNADVYLAYSSTVGIMGAGVDIGAEEYDLVISNASPVQGDTGIAILIDPSWTNPTAENTSDGYFKVGACPCNAGDSVWTNQAHKTSYDPGTLAYNTAHCWRVDIDHNGGTETGTNYGFTTASQANPPTPEGSGIVYSPKGLNIVHHKKGLGI